MKDYCLKRCLRPAILLALAGLLSSAGCVAREEGASRRSLLQTYAAAHGEGAADVGEKTARELTLRQAYGYTKPYAPVLEYPEVQRIWIPDQRGADGSLITGHWVFIILHEPRWMQVDEHARGIEFPTIIPYKP